MSDWKTAEEWAREDLPNLPTTKRNVNALARRESWQSLGPEKARRRKARGGGWEYHLSCLPTAAQADYARRTEAGALKKRVTQAVTPENLDARRRKIMEARAAVILELERRAVLCGDFSRAVAEFLAEAKAGLLQEPFASTVKTAQEKSRGLTPSRATLYNWRKALRAAQGDPMALVPAKRLQESKQNIDDLYPWFPLFLRHYAKPQKPTIAKAVDKVFENQTAEQEADWGAHGPSYQKARRALKSLQGTGDFLTAFKGREGPLALKARLSFKRRTFEGMDPTTVYTSDGKTFDAEVAHPIHGQPFRPEITTVLDVVTRRCVGVSVGLAENAQGVTDALRRSCSVYGICAIFYTDNGPGYKNKTLDHETLGLCARLGITSTNSIAYNSQARGIIERANATLWNVLAQEFPTYLGAPMDPEAKKRVNKRTRSDLKQIGSSKLLPSWEEFTTAVQRTVDEYNDRPHSALRIRDPETGRMRKASPNEVWADFEARGFEAETLRPEETDDLFRPYMERICKRGEVQFLGNHYQHDALEPYHGLKVLVGYDPFDAGRVWVRKLEQIDGQPTPGALICVADFWNNKERYYPVSFTEAAQERRTQAALKRQDVKRDRTLAELRAPLLEASAEVPMEPISAEPEKVPATEAPNVVVLQPAAQPDPRNPYNDDDIDLAWSIVEAAPDTIIPAGHIRLMSDFLRNVAALDMAREVGLPLQILADRIAAAQEPQKSSIGGQYK